MAKEKTSDVSLCKHRSRFDSIRKDEFMRFSIEQLFVFLVPLLIAAPLKNLAYAAPGPLLQVTELYQQSDIVAIGRVQVVSVQGTTFIDWNSSRISGRVARAELTVDKLIKGNSQQNSLLDIGENWSKKCPKISILHQFVKKDVKLLKFAIQRTTE
ncbi:MAG: hypothetical protein L0287_30090 [Anaerolineae bacterium]|nr:hypothetical protein [Anaerolineae bacterium]